jgi:CRISPR-associated endonuclease/helicase Cas3
MGTNNIQFFTKYFARLAGVERPYPWQTRLFEALIAGEWPDSLGLPTGCGKTGLMQVWIIALAWSQLMDRDATSLGIPRRLAWVVNRRVVVDQATTEAERIADEIGKLPLGDELCAALRRCSGSEDALAVSTLRGEKADNRKWSRDPRTPAIIVGTVDMIGSRLLFRGYGDGRYFRPVHAGLLGVDALIVNDEAHLSPAFAALLPEIERLCPAGRLAPKRFHTMLLSATSAAASERPFDHSLEEDLIASDHFRRVYTADKRLRLREASDQNAVSEALLELAAAPGASRTIVYVEQPEKAAKFASRLQEATGSLRVALLTGTMRGWERDGLAGDPIFAAFTREEPPEERTWLVSTSAGEVGVNITCERLITGLVSSDHLIQRFGRLNRFPLDRLGPGEAYLVHTALPEQKIGEPVPVETATVQYLRGLAALPDGSYDVSARSVYENPPPKEARSAIPPLARFDPRLIDLWSLTTAPDAEAPPVEPWLHGKQDKEWPETAVAWRDDVKYLAREDVSDGDREEVLRRYRVLAHERLSEPTSRVKEKIAKLAEKEPGERALVVDRDGDIRVETLAEIADWAPEALAYALVLLPSGCGSLEHGMFRPEPAGSDPTRYDVADEGQPRERFVARFGEDVWRLERLGGGGGELELESLDRDAVLRFAADKRPLLVAVSKPDEGDPDKAQEFVLYLTAKLEKRGGEAKLGPHLMSVAEKASELALGLELPQLENAFREAGERHDIGKKNPLWQHAMGGSTETPLAKTRMAVAPALLAGYRHELGSLVEASRQDGVGELSLHLIASHHGWARPYFEPKGYDRRWIADSREAAIRAAQRFGEFQTAWGTWGLAYLETLMKSADGLVSQAEEGAQDE